LTEDLIMSLFWGEVNERIWRELNLSVMESRQKGIKRPGLTRTFSSAEKHKKSNLTELILTVLEKIKIGRKKF